MRYLFLILFFSFTGCIQNLPSSHLYFSAILKSSLASNPEVGKKIFDMNYGDKLAADELVYFLHTNIKKMDREQRANLFYLLYIKCLPDAGFSYILQVLFEDYNIVIEREIPLVDRDSCREYLLVPQCRTQL